MYCNGVEICDKFVGCGDGIFLYLNDGIECTIDICDEDVDVILYILDYVLC